MKRFKSIDIILGLYIVMMICGHTINQWLRPEDYQLCLTLESSLAPIGASGSLFVSGIATFLSYQNKLLLNEDFNKYNISRIRNEYKFIANSYNNKIVLIKSIIKELPENWQKRLVMS